MDKVKVRIGTRFVHLPYAGGQLRYYLDDLISYLTETQTFTNFRGERITNETEKYYYANEDKTEYRFPICVKDRLITILKGNMPEDKIDIEEVTIPEGDDIELTIADSFSYRDGQEKFVDYLVDNGSSTRLLPASTGCGKALLNGTPVKTPTGWRAIEDLRVGDKVMGGDGKPTNVTGVFPNPNVKMYKITTHDGREVVACEDHQWTYFNAGYVRSDWKTNSTNQMLKEFKTSNDRIYIPLTKPVESENTNLPIDPWFLGALIGDGCFTNGVISLSSSYPEIYERAAKIATTFNVKVRSVPQGGQSKGIDHYYGRNGCKERNQLKLALNKLKLMGCLSASKFIPRIYLDAGLEQRFELARGLMDTDGEVGKRGTLSYSTMSKQLALDVRELFWSLGAIVKISPKQVNYNYPDGKKRVCWRLFIRHPETHKLVTIKHKLERAKPTQYANRLKVRIKSIEEYGYHDGTCISVDNESQLFVTKDYIVTHNTVSFLVAISKIAKRSIVFIKPRYQSTWFKDMKWLLPNDVAGEDYIWVAGGDELKELIRKVAEGEDLPKIVLMSAPTFQTYVTKHQTYKLAKDEHGRPYKTSNMVVEDYYDLNPEEFLVKGGFGVKGVDEAHEEMAWNAVLDSFNPLGNNLYLTATLMAEQGIKKYMQDKLYPRELRCPVPPPVKHVHMVGVNYRLNFFDKPLKHKSPMGYSHVNFEKSLMQQPKRRKLYFDMVTRMVLEYGKEALNNDHKVLVWFATKNMISAYLKYLKPKVGDKYSVVQYVAGTSKDALKADIIVSTPGRSSTGLDLPGLCTCINTIASSSKNLNIQMFGRIRELKSKVELKPYYVYLWTQDIDKHGVYHRKRKEDHTDRFLSFTERFYPGRI